MKNSFLPPQSAQTAQAAGEALFTSPKALGLNYAEASAKITGPTIGTILKLFVPSDLPKRRLYLFIEAAQGTVNENLVGSVQLLQNNSLVAELPVRLLNESSSASNLGFSVAAVLSYGTGAPTVFTDDSMSTSFGGTLYIVPPYRFTLQFDTAKLIIKRDDSSGNPRSYIMGILSETL